MLTLLCATGAPLTALAARTVERVPLRGEGSFASSTLYLLFAELAAQLLPPPKDARRAALAEALHAPLMKELTRQVHSMEPSMESSVWSLACGV